MRFIARYYLGVINDTTTNKVKFAGHHKNIRLPDYDYHNGWFFITNKTNFSYPYLISSVHDLVEEELQTVAERNKGVSLDYATIVPTHVHCVLIFNDSEHPLSEVWRRVKARTTLMTGKNGLVKGSLWQPNYFEHIIRNEKALTTIREYIKNNPLKENLPLNEIYEKKLRVR